MPEVKSSAKAHTSAIPDQEIDVPSSHEGTTSSDHESENEISFHPSRSQAPNSSNAKYVHALYRGIKNGLDS